MKCYAYAKINIMLYVEGKLENGYHSLKMLNAKVSLADELEFTLNNVNAVEYSIDELNHLENNLCLNVLNELTSLFNIKEHYHIYIRKNIPLGAGRGGGSSYVASIINFINDKHNLNLTLDEKINIGIKYGADVPYCLINDVCYVEGIGEKLTILDYKINKDVLIIYPNIFVSTKEVFNNVKLYNSAPSINEVSYMLNNDFPSVLHNDLEEATFKLNPTLRKLKKSLQQYGDLVMSGSGSTMLLFTSDISIISKLKEKYPEYLIIPTKIL